MPPKQKEFQIAMKDEEHFLQYFNEKNKKLLVIDLHQEWAGPCEIMFPTYKALAQSIDDFEKKIDFVTLDVSKLKELKHDKLNYESCKPRFYFALEGKIVSEVDGANVPEFTEKVYKHMPYV